MSAEQPAPPVTIGSIGGPANVGVTTTTEETERWEEPSDTTGAPTPSSTTTTEVAERWEEPGDTAAPGPTGTITSEVVDRVEYPSTTAPSTTAEVGVPSTATSMLPETGTREAVHVGIVGTIVFSLGVIFAVAARRR